MIKAIIRLIFITNRFFLDGMEYILFTRKQVADYTMDIYDLDIDKETISFVDSMGRQNDG